jgi:hypothetical protein
MLLRVPFILIAFLFCGFRVLAQVYEPGLLVRSNGDTVRGEIENNFWLNPPKFIHFRRTPTSSPELVRPHQLRTVLFTQGRYFRFEALPIDHAAETRLDRLPVGLHPDVRVDSLLAEVLLEGSCSLLRVVQFSTTHYLLRRPGQPVLDLSERQYIARGPNGQLVVVDGNNYKGQLGIYFGDCPAVSAALPTTPFTAEGLARLVQAFEDACASPHLPTRSWLARSPVRGRMAFGLGVVAGGQYHRVFNQLHPFAGLYAEMLLPNRTLAAYGELCLSQFTGEGSMVASYNESTVVVNGTSYPVFTPINSDFRYRAWEGTVRLGLRGFLPAFRHQQWVVSGGVEYNWLFSPSFTTVSGPPVAPTLDQTISVASIPVAFAGLGWRNQRLTASFDVPFYYTDIQGMRASLAFRVSRSPDTQAKPTIGQ